MRKTTRLLLLFSVLLSSSNSFAAGYIRIAGVYLSNSEGQTTMTDTSRTLLEGGGGWISDKGFSLGALYATEKMKNGSSTSDRTSMGPTLGWITRKEQGFYVLGTYHYSSELSPNQWKGNGYQLDLGYKFKISKVGLALQMSYKHFEYNKSGSSTISPPYKTNKIDPYISLFFEF